MVALAARAAVAQSIPRFSMLAAIPLMIVPLIGYNLVMIGLRCDCRIFGLDQVCGPGRLDRAVTRQSWRRPSLAKTSSSTRTNPLQSTWSFAP
jgi:hypothetical protein